MEIYVSQQAGVFLWTVLAGICASLVYDMFRIYRKLFKMPDWAVFVCDSVFWIVSSAISFAAVLYSNSGEIRWFIFAGLVIGVILYFMLLTNPVSKTVLLVLKIILIICLFIKRITGRIVKTVLKPLRPVRGHLKKTRKAVKSMLHKPNVQIRLLKKIRKNSRAVNKK